MAEKKERAECDTLALLDHDLRVLGRVLIRPSEKRWAIPMGSTVEKIDAKGRPAEG
ncbi:MAG TPA: hypothetical protein VJN63_00205 [Thermoplasmata archaeon]|nr:hypothetical protein [Thermoplasmata archaeon]